MIVTIRTDKPEAEAGIYDAAGNQLAYHTWYAHRELSKTLLSTIRDQLVERQAAFDAIQGIVVFKGSGSFTGLRIGITVANTLAYGLGVPIVGSDGDAWQDTGVSKILDGKSDHIVLPNYGSDAHITKQKK